MALEPAKCTQCGGELEVDNTKGWNLQTLWHCIYNRESYYELPYLHY